MTLAEFFGHFTAEDLWNPAWKLQPPQDFSKILRKLEKESKYKKNDKNKGNKTAQ